MSARRESKPRPPVDCHTLEPRQLERFLERRRAHRTFPLELSLAENLAEILRRANGFVPSAAGSILLDDPAGKHEDRQKNTLTFIVAFGDKSEALVGQTIASDRGIAGHAYLSGEVYSTSDAAADPFFFSGVDAKTSYQTLSLIAIPIRIEQDICGVLELVNRRGQTGFSEQDRNLLEIFAGYISISIQNVLDGRAAQEIAKRDNLTGLYNDRYLHIVASETVARCRAEGTDLAILFLDLDYFKRVNDSHGHLAGSQVLREAGQILRRQASRVNGISARYGGDEFVLVLPGTNLEGAVDVAEEIRTEIIETAFCAASGEIQTEVLNLRGLTCSIGVATVRAHLDEDQPTEEVKGTLLRLADAAMYVAKETGRNRTAVAGQPVRRRTLGGSLA